MDQTSEEESIPDYPIDVSMEAFADMVKILDALGNEDSLAIFLFAQEGIQSSKDAIQVLGLTQKRFYSRLKDLLENKLLEKVEGEYRHTLLGKIVYDMGISLETILKNQEKLKIMNQMSKAKDLTDNERKELMHIFNIDISSPLKGARMVDSFDELVSITVNMMEGADEEIMMATQYIDQRVIDTGFKVIEKGVKIKGIVAQPDQFTHIMKILLSIISNPKQISFLTNYLKSPDFEVRFTSIPYTFIVADKKKSMIELKNPITNQFQFAFVIESEKFSEKLAFVFESLWETATELKEKIKI